MSPAFITILHRIAPIFGGLSGLLGITYAALCWLAFDDRRVEDRLIGRTGLQDFILMSGFGCFVLGIVSMAARWVSKRFGGAHPPPRWLWIAWLPSIGFVMFILAGLLQPLLKPFIR
jgi:hypothetical protein